MAVVFKALAFLLVLSLADADSSFSFNGFAKSLSFDKNIALFRDSKLLVDDSGDSPIQLTDSVSQSQGRVLYKKPIKLFQQDRNFSGSFSSSFSCSMLSSKEIGSVLAFVMVPSGLDLSLFGRKDNTSSGLGFLMHNEIVAVEFGISTRGNRVGILVGRPESARIRNLSSFDGYLNGDKKLNCWIDYEASSKRIEVRFSVSTALKPLDPFVSYSVDLAKICKEKTFMVGLISANGNSSKPHYLHSWRFKLRYPSVSIHSQPLDPNAVSKTAKEVEVKPVEVKGKSKCIWVGLGLLVLGAVCGSLSTMLAVYIWTICGNRQRSVAVVPEDCADEKSEIVVIKAAAVDDEEGKK